MAAKSISPISEKEGGGFLEPHAQHVPTSSVTGYEDGGEVEPEEYLYHATLTKNLPSIMKRGILEKSEPNWTIGEGGANYGNGEVYATTHPEDAARWAGRLDWAKHKKIGSGKVSIVKFKKNPKDEWKIDESDPLAQAVNKGLQVKLAKSVIPENIVSSEPYVIHRNTGGEVEPIHKAGGGGFDPDANAFGRIGTDPQQQLQSRLAGPQIMKEPGGQWLSGSVENALKLLRSEVELTSPEEILSNWGEWVNHPIVQRANHIVQRAHRAKAVNDFVSKQLTRYVKNDMGTERDPIRALAERGILHYLPSQYGNEDLTNDLEYAADAHRKMSGRASHPIAKLWENNSDYAIKQLKKSEINEDDINENPWINKLDPLDIVNGMDSWRYGTDRKLGFDHLVDELHNSVNPESGLPNHLQLNPESLSRMSVPQAVQHVHNINKWREDNRAEANKKLAFNPATFLHKDYPGTDYAWYQIKHPSWYPRRPYSEGHEKELEGDKHLEEALKYEGNTMGHCVGGYTDEVASGDSKIYSLRNKKTGEPHVTVEANPSEQEAFGAPPDIAQIKGKGNKKPVDRYLPYVQDFVKSGNWGRVGDIQNTDLVDLSRHPEHQHIVQNHGRFHTKEEANNLLSKNYGSGFNPYATGGAIIARATGGVVDPQKAIRRAMMIAKGVENAAG